MVIKMTTKQAREFHVKYHMINTDIDLDGNDGIIEVFNKIKSIQYDPLNVVGRNSDLVLQSRVTNYQPYLLENALYKDRTLIDAWDKMMGIYQTKDYPYFSRIRSAMGDNIINTLDNRLSTNAIGYINDVLKHIAIAGPTFSSELNFGKLDKQIWGHTKISSAALDYLFQTGKIGIKEKRNTQKRYDLIENLIGEICHLKDPNFTEEDFIKWYLLRRISSQGIVSNKSGVMWSGPHISNKKIRSKYLDLFVKENVITKVEIEGLTNEYFLVTSDLKSVYNIQKRVSFIAPLDNLIWDRELVKKIYNFDYKWEVYTPIVKRKYGYYVLPILYGCEFVGRIEFKQQRNNEDLQINHIWYEDGFKQSATYKKALDIGLKKFAKYLGANSVIYN